MIGKFQKRSASHHLKGLLKIRLKFRHRPTSKTTHSVQESIPTSPSTPSAKNRVKASSTDTRNLKPLFHRQALTIAMQRTARLPSAPEEATSDLYR